MSLFFIFSDGLRGHTYNNSVRIEDMIQFIPFKFPGINGVECVFTTRLGGISQGEFSFANLSFDVGDDVKNVETNRKLLLSTMGISNIVELKQVHGEKLTKIEEIPEEDLEADALVTSMQNTALLIKTADCQPVLVAHKSGKYIGAFHVGWRANRGKFIVEWIKKFCVLYDISPEDICAVRGPSLDPAHSEFVNFAQEFGNDFKKYYDPENQTVDLWTLTRDQLLMTGILEKNIFSIDLCTYCLEDIFFSYRRNKRCGRQGGIIYRKI